MALGIRYFNSTAIDLWQGNADQFVADHSLDLTGRPQELPVLAVNTETIRGCGARHLKIVIPLTMPANLAAELMAALINALGSASPRRVTWIMPTLDHYDSFQEALFSTFAEVAEHNRS
jgi:DNA polymerase IIIc chi subunit